METQLTAEEKRKKFLYEIKDLFEGAAFPLMIMLILSASVISFSSTDEKALSAVILVFGELLLIVAYIIFGKQSGVVAVRRTVQHEKKRQIGSGDLKVKFKTGEYALYKGFLIGFISCIPYIIVQIIGSSAPNKICDFLLIYAFGWAYFPLSYAGVTGWLNLLTVIPLTCVHAAAYYLGAKSENKKQAKVAEIQNIKGKS